MENSRFELMSASPYTSPSFGRSSSFREGSESSYVNSGRVNSRGSAISSRYPPLLSQSLMLEPIVMCDPRYARSGEVKRALANSVGGNSEENAFVSAHPKNSPPAAVDDLKRLRASVADTCVKASGRAKKLDEHLTKLNKYVEALPSKKPQQQRNEPSTNSGSTLKISQMQRNSSQVGLSKRSRTSTIEPRAECRNNEILRQTTTVAKERDIIEDNNADSHMAEGKIRRLPAGGEGWDKKIKRKRSFGAVPSRSIDNDGELKRNMHNKLSIDSSPLPSTHGFRSGASSGVNKLENMSSPARVTFKSKQEKRDVSGGPIKERPIGKVNVKLNNHEEIQTLTSSPIQKGKASRAPRSSYMAAANSSTNVPRTLESWEESEVVNKNTSLVGPNNRKRPFPSRSSSPPISWRGQRPQKISRTRRTNLIPVSNNDEVQMQSEGCSPTDSSAGAYTSLLSTGSQNPKIKPENVPLSESEESSRMNDKGVANGGQSVGPSAIIPIKKNKAVAKEDIGNGVTRQGRSARASPFSRASVSPTREKLDNLVASKPLRNARSGFEKSGSKSGRPLKKLSDHKNFSRLGHVANGGSPDCSGESDDDREELLTAANFASSFSFNACSSAFWKTFETLFASIGPDEKSYLSQQLKLANANLSENRSNGNSDQDLDDYSGEVLPSSGSVNIAPLYQRLLSALIMEDEVGEFEEIEFSRPRKNGNAHKIFPCNGNMAGALDYICNGDLTQRDEVDVLVRLSKFDHAPQSLLANGGGISSFDFQYDQMGVEEKLVVELQSIGLFLEDVPAMDDKEEDGINHQIAKSKKGFLEQVTKTKTCMDKIDRALQEGNEIGRDTEQVAMDKLVELAYKKLLATRRAYASKNGIAKVSKQVALASCRKALSRCHRFEDSGISCFSEPSLREILYASPPQFSANDALGTSNRLSDPGIAISNRGKKKELSLDDIGGSLIRAISGCAKGKRSERERDSTKNGRLSTGDRKTKSKPKQKTTALLSVEPANNRRKDVRFISSESSKEKEALEFTVLPLDNIDGIEELGVDCDSGAPQDLNSWFNFEVDGLQEDHDEPVVGLEIPMDDLSDLLMF